MAVRGELGVMAIRVLASIPEVTVGPAREPSGPIVAAPPIPERLVPPEAAASPPPAARTGPILPAAGRRFRPAGHRRRTAAEVRFPIGSVAALALIAIAIWSIVAYRERGNPAPVGPAARLAAAPEEVRVAAPETTLR